MISRDAGALSGGVFAEWLFPGTAGQRGDPPASVHRQSLANARRIQHCQDASPVPASL